MRWSRFATEHTLIFFITLFHRGSRVAYIFIVVYDCHLISSMFWDSYTLFPVSLGSTESKVRVGSRLRDHARTFDSVFAHGPTLVEPYQEKG
jgi:hypothetical protein